MDFESGSGQTKFWKTIPVQLPEMGKFSKNGAVS